MYSILLVIYRGQGGSIGRDRTRLKNLKDSLPLWSQLMVGARRRKLLGLQPICGLLPTYFQMFSVTATMLGRSPLMFFTCSKSCFCDKCTISSNFSTVQLAWKGRIGSSRNERQLMVGAKKKGNQLHFVLASAQPDSVSPYNISLAGNGQQKTKGGDGTEEQDGTSWEGRQGMLTTGTPRDGEVEKRALHRTENGWREI